MGYHNIPFIKSKRAGKRGDALATWYYQGRNPILHFRMSDSSATVASSGSLTDTVAEGAGTASPTYGLASRLDGGTGLLYGGDGNKGHYETGKTAVAFGTDYFCINLVTKAKTSAGASHDSILLRLANAGGTDYVELGIEATTKKFYIKASGASADYTTVKWAKAATTDLLTAAKCQLTVTFPVDAADARLFINGSEITKDSGGGDLSGVGAISDLTVWGIGGFSSADNTYDGWIDEVWACLGLGFYDNDGAANILGKQKGGKLHYLLDVASGDLTDTGSDAVTLADQNTDNLQYRQTAPAFLNYSISNRNVAGGNNGYFYAAGPTDSIELSTGDFIQVFQAGLPTAHSSAAINGFGMIYAGGLSAAYLGNYFLAATKTLKINLNDDDSHLHVIGLRKTDVYDTIKDGQLHELVTVWDRSESSARFYLDGSEVQSFLLDTVTLAATSSAVTLDGARTLLSVQSDHSNALLGNVAEWWISTGTSWYHNYPATYTASTTTYSRQTGSPLIHHKFTEDGTDVSQLQDYGSAAQTMVVTGTIGAYSATGPAGLDYGITCKTGYFYKSGATTATIGTNDFVILTWMDFSSATATGQKFLWHFTHAGTSGNHYVYLDMSTKTLSMYWLNDAGTNTYTCEIAKADLYDLCLDNPCEVAFIFDRSETTMGLKVNNVSKTVTNTGGTSLSNLSTDSIVWDNREIGGYGGIHSVSHWGSFYEWWLSTGLTYTSNF